MSELCRRRWREHGQAGAPLEKRRRSVCDEAPALLLRRVLAGRATVRPCDAPGGLDIDLAGTDDGRTVEPEQRDLRRAGILRAGTGPQLFGLAARSEVTSGSSGRGQRRSSRPRPRKQRRRGERNVGSCWPPLVTEPRQAGSPSQRAGLPRVPGARRAARRATRKARRTSPREADPTGLIVWLRGQDLNL